MIIKCKAVLVVPLAVLWHSWPALRVTVGRVVLAVWPQFRGARWDTTAAARVIAHFFKHLYPNVGDGWLVLSAPDPTALTRQGKPALRSAWFDLARAPLPRIAQAAAQLATRQNVYYGVALQHPATEPGVFRRSKNATAYRAPGLWCDLDLSYGQHATSALPTTDREALDFLSALPAQPSLIVHSGGGLYGYWLFRDSFSITTIDELHTITRLSKQFTHTLVTYGNAYGWTLDALGDLARVLRPPGTINHKYGEPVVLIGENERRYRIEDFDWLLDLPLPVRYRQPGSISLNGQPPVVQVAAHYGAELREKSRTELAGAHPQHGSSTGDNFNLNPDRGLCHCWRHGTGGDALSLIAVCEGLLPCEHAGPGTLTGDRFWRAVALANRVFGTRLALHQPGDDVRRVHGIRVRQGGSALAHMRTISSEEARRWMTH